MRMESPYEGLAFRNLIVWHYPIWGASNWMDKLHLSFSIVHKRCGVLQNHSAFDVPDTGIPQLSHRVPNARQLQRIRQFKA
jgi:hypothetical protein